MSCEQRSGSIAAIDALRPFLFYPSTRLFLMLHGTFSYNRQNLGLIANDR